MSSSSAADQQVAAKPVVPSADTPDTTEEASLARSSSAAPASGTATGSSAASPAKDSAPAPASQEGEATSATEEAGGGADLANPGQRVTSRRVRLSVARLDPWSVMKVAFLLSVAAGIAMVVATAVLWLVLSGLNVFADLERVVRDLQPVTAEPFSIMDYIGLARVVSLAVVIAVVNVVLISALSTLGAFLYNICSSLVGGVRMTLTDD